MDATDEVILTLTREGKSLREIGQTIGFSHVAVKKRLDSFDPARNDIPETITDGIEHNFQPCDDGHIETSQYPKLHEALLRIDEILAVIEKRLGKPIAVETPGGWKIDR